MPKLTYVSSLTYEVNFLCKQNLNRACVLGGMALKHKGAVIKEVPHSHFSAWLYSRISGQLILCYSRKLCLYSDFVGLVLCDHPLFFPSLVQLGGEQCCASAAGPVPQNDLQVCLLKVSWAKRVGEGGGNSNDARFHAAAENVDKTGPEPEGQAIVCSAFLYPTKYELIYNDHFWCILFCSFLKKSDAIPCYIIEKYGSIVGLYLRSSSLFHLTRKLLQRLLLLLLSSVSFDAH